MSMAVEHSEAQLIEHSIYASTFLIRHSLYWVLMVKKFIEHFFDRLDFVSSKILENSKLLIVLHN